jgi:hypothetical protein
LLSLFLVRLPSVLLLLALSWFAIVVPVLCCFAPIAAAASCLCTVSFLRLC